MIDVLIGAQVAAGFMLAGFIWRDWEIRKLTITRCEELKKSADDMVMKVYEIDSQRAKKLLEHDDAIQALKLRLDMKAVAAAQQHGKGTTL